MKFIDFFSGIGGFHSGLERAGMECVGWCEFDKFAQASYRAMYDTTDLWFGNDVTKVKGWELPKADLWTFGFPCQDVSIAGKQKGMKEGTRSGLFYEIMRLLDECKENKPKWLVCENVKNLLSIDGGTGFLNVIGEMAERGYSVEWKVQNSKDYGVPQNRERVYIVGYIGERCTSGLLPIKRESAAVIKQVGNLRKTNSFGGNHQTGRVYSTAGIAPTLNTCGGGDREPKIISARACLTPDREEKRQNGRRLKDEGEPAFTLTSQDRHGVLIRTANKQGYMTAQVGDGVDLAYPDSETRRGRVQPQRSNTLTTSDNLGVLVDDETIQIRKLTPKECWRLQGFTDEQFDKAAAVNSNSQLYKQAGNAVTVNVVEEIGKHIMKIENEVNI
ncbi:DNA cytosine methyltransferase [Veillonella parvula]|uniref:DNA cytosine methyltransferase n=1 Tax=Veillonella parvula TaxID=29466 RepID=UPI00265EB321|nr:DNA cytosine methyltransferase [Veillonella parvula]